LKYRPEYDLELIGRNLKRLRESKKLSVDKVREYLRLGSVQAVYKYEKGKGYPPADTMFALMELYEADLYDIVCEHDNVCSIQEENQGFSSVVLMVDDIQVDIINLGHYKREQSARIKKTYEYWMEMKTKNRRN